MVIAKQTYTFDDADLITLTEAKANLRVDHDLDDAEIQVMIYAAYQSVENYLNRVLLNSAITYNLEGSQNGFSMALPAPGVSKQYSVVKAIDSEGNEVATTSHNLTIANNVVTVSDVVLATDVTVTYWLFTITYAPTLLNQVINAAVYLTLTHYYENRSAVVIGTTSNALPLGVQSILSFYRYIPV